MGTVGGATEALFKTNPECPSELRLDQLHSRELSAADAAGVRAHVAGCSRCLERVAFRERGFAAFAGVDPGRMVRSIEERVPRREVPARVSRRMAWVPVAASAVAACVVAAILIPRGGDEIRPKGTLGLTVFRERGGKVERVIAGDRVRAKDRLRFEVSVPAAVQEIMIVSVEDGGKMFTYYPSDGTEKSRPPKVTSDGALEGAIELDASLADEQIYLIACPQTFAVPDLKTSLPPKNCEATSLLIKKEGAP